MSSTRDSDDADETTSSGKVRKNYVRFYALIIRFIYNSTRDETRRVYLHKISVYVHTGLQEKKIVQPVYE